MSSMDMFLAMANGAMLPSKHAMHICIVNLRRISGVSSGFPDRGVGLGASNPGPSCGRGSPGGGGGTGRGPVPSLSREETETLEEEPRGAARARLAAASSRNVALQGVRVESGSCDARGHRVQPPPGSPTSPERWPR